MDLGQLNKVIVFKQNVPIQKGAGKEDVYTTLLTTRGSMVQKSSNRYLGYGEIKNGTSWECVTRWQEALDGLDFMKMKVEYDSKTFQITSVEKVDEKRFYLKFGLSLDER